MVFSNEALQSVCGGILCNQSLAFFENSHGKVFANSSIRCMPILVLGVSLHDKRQSQHCPYYFTNLIGYSLYSYIHIYFLLLKINFVYVHKYMYVCVCMKVLLYQIFHIIPQITLNFICQFKRNLCTIYQQRINIQNIYRIGRFICICNLLNEWDNN